MIAICVQSLEMKYYFSSENGSCTSKTACTTDYVSKAISVDKCSNNSFILFQRIVGMEEKQAMMSRAELQSMIAQLEEVEKKSSAKTTELSGIRTNPAEGHPRKKLSQEEKQMSFR